MATRAATHVVERLDVKKTLKGRDDGYVELREKSRLQSTRETCAGTGMWRVGSMREVDIWVEGTDPSRRGATDFQRTTVARRKPTGLGVQNRVRFSIETNMY